VKALVLALCLQSTPQEEVGETVVATPRTTKPKTDTSADRIVVTAEELAATGERSLPKQLGKAAGVWIQETNLGGGSPLIQGLSGNQVLLVIDGVRMNDATTRSGVNQMLNGVDPATVDRIEVIRGPRSVLYGSDALGGVVLIWTKTRKPAGDAPTRTGLHGAVEGRYDSATEGWAGALELSGASSRFGWTVVGGYHDYDTLHTADGEVPNVGYEGDSYFGSFEAMLDPDRSLRATAMMTRDYDVPRTDRMNAGFGQTNPANDEYFFNVQDRQRYVLAYNDRSGGALADIFEARLSYRYYREERHIRGFGSNTRRLEEDTTNTVGIGLDFKKAVSDDHLLTYGVDADYDDVDSLRTDVDITTGAGTPNDGAFAPGSRYLGTGVFIQDEISSFAPWDVTVGARYAFYDFGFDDVSTGAHETGSFDDLSGSLSVGRAVGEGWSLVGTLARGFRAPNLAELARDATFFGGDELHNPDLEPETSLYAEIACEVKKPTWNGAVAVFHNNISDVVGSRLIDPGGAGSGDEIYLRENIGTLEVIGAYVLGTTRLGGAESPWSTNAYVEYTWGQQYSDFVDPNTGEQPFDDEPGQRIPPLHGRVGLQRDFSSWVRWAELAAHWALEQDRLSPQDLGDPRIDPNGTDGWVSVDFDIGGPIGDGRGNSSWMLGVHNIFDESYRIHGSGMDAPGRGLVAGVRWSR